MSNSIYLINIYFVLRTFFVNRLCHFSNIYKDIVKLVALLLSQFRTFNSIAVVQTVITFAIARNTCR